MKKDNNQKQEKPTKSAPIIFSGIKKLFILSFATIGVIAAGLFLWGGIALGAAAIEGIVFNDAEFCWLPGKTIPTPKQPTFGCKIVFTPPPTTPIPTPTPTPTPIPTNKTTTKTTAKPTTNTDPPVHCNIADACGGGTKPLKQSECDNTTCCLYSSGARLVTKQECSGGTPTLPTLPTRQPSTNNTYDQNKTYPCYIDGITYYYTNSECINKQNDYWKNKSSNPFPTYQPTYAPSPTPLPTVDPALRESCKQDATTVREMKYEYCRRVDWDNSAEEMMCFASAKSEWENNVYLCATLPQ